MWDETLVFIVINVSGVKGYRFLIGNGFGSQFEVLSILSAWHWTCNFFILIDFSEIFGVH